MYRWRSPCSIVFGGQKAAVPRELLLIRTRAARSVIEKVAAKLYFRLTSATCKYVTLLVSTRIRSIYNLSCKYDSVKFEHRSYLLGGGGGAKVSKDIYNHLYSVLVRNNAPPDSSNRPEPIDFLAKKSHNSSLACIQR